MKDIYKILNNHKDILFNVKHAHSIILIHLIYQIKKNLSITCIHEPTDYKFDTHPIKILLMLFKCIWRFHMHLEKLCKFFIKC